MAKCNDYPSCKRSDGKCACFDFQQRCAQEKEVKKFAEMHGYSYSWPHFPKSLKMHLKKESR